MFVEYHIIYRAASVCVQAAVRLWEAIEAAHGHHVGQLDAICSQADLLAVSHLPQGRSQGDSLLSRKLNADHLWRSSWLAVKAVSAIHRVRALVCSLITN